MLGLFWSNQDAFKIQGLFKKRLFKKSKDKDSLKLDSFNPNLKVIWYDQDVTLFVIMVLNVIFIKKSAKLFVKTVTKLFT